MMTPENAKNALVFLERASLSGKEVSAYIAVLSALNTFAHPVPPQKTTEDNNPLNDVIEHGEDTPAT